MLLTLLSHTCLYMYIPLYCYVLVMPFRKLSLWLFFYVPHPEIKQKLVSGIFATVLFCVVQLVLLPEEQSRLLSGGLPLFHRRNNLVALKPRFPMLSCENTFPWLLYFLYCYQRLILKSFFPSFFFFVLPSQTALESNSAHLFQMEIILRLQDTNPSECVDRSSLWVSLLVLSIYFHLNQLSLKTHKTWSSAMCVFHYKKKSWAHIVDISLTASLQMLIWTC